MAVGVGMSDLIDRQKAIETLENLTCYGIDEMRNLCDASVSDSEGWLGGIKDAIDELQLLPSAEPERKTGEWIPFEVALPNDRQKVLCVNKHGDMMVGGYMSDYGMTFPCYFEKPVAWMPLPEPWRGEE